MAQQRKLSQTAKTSDPGQNAGAIITPDQAKQLPIRSVNAFKRWVEQPAIMEMIQKAIAKHVKPKHILGILYTAMSRTPKLQNCTPMSLMNSAIDAGICGCVTIGGTNARGYVIPYKNKYLSGQAREDVYEAQFMSSYLGLCDMARNTGKIVFVEAFPVFEGDEFEYDLGKDPPVRHRPSNDPKQQRAKDKLLYVYARAKYVSGEMQFRVLTIAEVEEHRARSRAANEGPWVTDYVPMALKTAVRVLCKWLPQSVEMAEQMTKQDEREFASGAEFIDVSPMDTSSRTEGLAKRLAAKEEDSPTDEQPQAEGQPIPATQAQAFAAYQATMPPSTSEADLDTGWNRLCMKAVPGKRVAEFGEDDWGRVLAEAAQGDEPETAPE